MTTRPLRTALIVAVLLAASLGGPLESAPPESSPETVVSLDPVLKRALKKRFPGYRLASKKDYPDYLRGDLCPAGPGHQWSYGALKADFNGDGLDDYTMIVRHRRLFLWVAALREGETYRIEAFGPTVVEHEDSRPVKTQKRAGLLLTIGPPGGLAQDAIPLNPFPCIRLVGDGESIEAYWKNGAWIRNDFVD